MRLCTGEGLCTRKKEEMDADEDILLDIMEHDTIY